jgi:hypothetical protein
MRGKPRRVAFVDGRQYTSDRRRYSIVFDRADVQYTAVT